MFKRVWTDSVSRSFCHPDWMAVVWPQSMAISVCKILRFGKNHWTGWNRVFFKKNQTNPRGSAWNGIELHTNSCSSGTSIGASETSALKTRLCRFKWQITNAICSDNLVPIISNPQFGCHLLLVHFLELHECQWSALRTFRFRVQDVHNQRRGCLCYSIHVVRNQMF